MLRPPGPLRPWPRRQSANCDRSSGMALPLTCLHPTTQNTTNERRKKGNLALRYPIPLLQMSNTPPPPPAALGAWRGSPWPEEKGRPDLPARPPGSCILAQGAQAQGQAELGLPPEPLRQWTQRAALLAREVFALLSGVQGMEKLARYSPCLPDPLYRELATGPFGAHVRL